MTQRLNNMARSARINKHGNLFLNDMINTLIQEGYEVTLDRSTGLYSIKGVDKDESSGSI